MFLSTAINLNDLPQNDQISGALPAGEYAVKIDKAELKTTNSGDGQYIKLQLRVTGPTHVNACVFTNLNIVNRNETAERIGKQQLRSIMEAINLQTITDTDQLIGGVMLVKISCQPDDYRRGNGDLDAMKNEVKLFKKLGGSTAIPSQQPVPVQQQPFPSPTQPRQQPQQQQQQQIPSQTPATARPW